jgi:hypothetical protein
MTQIKRYLHPAEVVINKLLANSDEPHESLDTLFVQTNGFPRVRE